MEVAGLIRLLELVPPTYEIDLVHAWWGTGNTVEVDEERQRVTIVLETPTHQ